MGIRDVVIAVMLVCGSSAAALADDRLPMSVTTEIRRMEALNDAMRLVRTALLAPGVPTLPNDVLMALARKIVSGATLGRPTAAGVTYWMPSEVTLLEAVSEPSPALKGATLHAMRFEIMLRPDAGPKPEGLTTCVATAVFNGKWFNPLVDCDPIRFGVARPTRL
jgi:hypothetical protein